jgi:hypothetical protein
VIRQAALVNPESCSEENHWTVVRGSDARKRHFPPRLWLARGVLREKELAVVSGRWDSFKSSFSLELAASVACGFDFLGEYEVEKRGPVLVIQEEIPDDDYYARVKRVLEGMPDERANNLLLLSRKRFTVAIGGQSEGFQAMEKIIAEQGVVLVVLDNLSRMYPPGFKENDAPAMTELLKPLSWLQDKYGVAFLIVHHDRKPLGDDRGATPRGSSVLENYPDVRIHIERRKEHLSRATVTIRGRGFGAREFGAELNEQTLRLEAADVPILTTDEQNKTLEVLEQLGGWRTPADVAGGLAISPEAARKRLERLSKSEKVDVDRSGGRPYRYSAVSGQLDSST